MERVDRLGEFREEGFRLGFRQFCKAADQHLLRDRTLVLYGGRAGSGTYRR